MVVLGLTALETVFQSISGRLPEREKEKRNDRREQKVPKKPQPAPSISAIGPCPTLIQISRLAGCLRLNGPLRQYFSLYRAVGVVGDAKVLDKFPVPGHPTILITVGQGPTALALGAGGGCLDIFTLIYPFSPLSPSLLETTRYRLKYCLKGPLNPTNYIRPSPREREKEKRSDS